MNYQEFIETKRWKNSTQGFDPLWLPDFLFDFQQVVTDWSVRTGRCGLFEDCGLGKTPQSLVWAENVVRKTNRPVLILTPLAVAPQFVREGEKFGVQVHHAGNGEVRRGINVVNYQRMHYFNPRDFAGVVCDESGVLKHQDSKTRQDVTEFAGKVQYCLLGTATPAPNDFMELGNSSEVLGVMRYGQMLSMYFVNDGDTTQQWRLRGHAKRKFWHWVSTWSRALRRPSDLGFDDGKFVLPPLKTTQSVVRSPRPKYGFIPQLAMTLGEQREERRRTLKERCERVAELANSVGDHPFIAWCHLNSEGDLLKDLIPGAVQVAGSDDDNVKEDRLNAFSQGRFRVLVTKPKIAGFGLNWQHCADVSFFPSHSFEQWYQAVRRCWRFGQKRPVTVNIVTSEAESLVLSNMQRKEAQAEELYTGIVQEMREFQVRAKPRSNGHLKPMELPSWLR